MGWGGGVCVCGGGGGGGGKQLLGIGTNRSEFNLSEQYRIAFLPGSHVLLIRSTASSTRGVMNWILA